MDNTQSNNSLHGVTLDAILTHLVEQHFWKKWVNPRHYKNVCAQKTDVKDCQWLHQPHVHGLLQDSHIAPKLYMELKDFFA